MTINSLEIVNKIEGNKKAISSFLKISILLMMLIYG